MDSLTVLRFKASEHRHRANAFRYEADAALDAYDLPGFANLRMKSRLHAHMAVEIEAQIAKGPPK